MNPDEIMKKATALEALMSSFDTQARNQNQNTADFEPGYFSNDLPHFTCTQQISSLQSQSRTHRYEMDLYRLNEIQDKVSRLQGISKSMVNINKLLTDLCDLRCKLFHLLKQSKREDVIPVPYDLQESFSTILKSISEIVANKHQLPVGLSLNWQETENILRSVANTLCESVSFLENNIQDHQKLQEDSTKLLKELSGFKFY